MGAQSLLGSKVKLLHKRVALTYYARNCAYANSCLLCFKLCRHNVRMSMWQDLGLRKVRTNYCQRTLRQEGPTPVAL